MRGLEPNQSMQTFNVQTLITVQYGTARELLANDDTLVLLHIGPEQTGIAVGQDAMPDVALTLTIGAQKTAREYFKHTPPSALELENAIVTVEDEITRVRNLMPAGARLVTTDMTIREITILSGITPGDIMRLPLQAMEQTFERLAQVCLRRPVPSDNLPTSKAFAATLLILREFMHHLQFADITVLPVDRRIGSI
jgi:exopolyphosphatase/pppGpp-phosphohydrolase